MNELDHVTAVENGEGKKERAEEGGVPGRDWGEGGYYNRDLYCHKL